MRDGGPRRTKSAARCRTGRGCRGRESGRVSGEGRGTRTNWWWWWWPPRLLRLPTAKRHESAAVRRSKAGTVRLTIVLPIAASPDVLQSLPVVVVVVSDVARNLVPIDELDALVPANKIGERPERSRRAKQRLTLEFLRRGPAPLVRRRRRLGVSTSLGRQARLGGTSVGVEEVGARGGRRLVWSVAAHTLASASWGRWRGAR